MARLSLPSRLELKRRDGSFSEAPLANVVLTTFLYVSPVQINPSCDHTGTPLHFHSSTTSRSARLMSARSRDNVFPRQSPSSSIRASMSREGESPSPELFFFFVVMMLLMRHPSRRCRVATSASARSSRLCRL